MPELKVVEPAPPTALVGLVDDYLAHCRAKGLSPKTVRDSYGFVLEGVFLPWCAREGLATPRRADAAGPGPLHRGPAREGGQAWPAESLLDRQLRGDGQLVAAPARRRGGDQRGRQGGGAAQAGPVLDVLSREEIQRLEDAAIYERDKLLVRLLADTGARVGEVVALRVNDLVERDRNHYLRFRGKGDKERLLPVPRLWRRLQRYVERGRSRDAASDRILLSQRRDRRTGDHEPLTNSGVEQLLRNLGEQAEMGKRVYPHLLRRR
ncbi:MAG TPA: tyrosine-type recombinase/integrase [Candidatus Dormibacteraeota bacterium]|nr:tyrosine-type recombinase/integrase [Candidatus Dormibacteraeota bacterium]